MAKIYVASCKNGRRSIHSLIHFKLDCFGFGGREIAFVKTISIIEIGVFAMRRNVSEL